MDKSEEGFYWFAGEAMGGENGVPGHDITMGHFVEQVLGETVKAIAGIAGDEEVPRTGVSIVRIGREGCDCGRKAAGAEMGGDGGVELCSR